MRFAIMDAPKQQQQQVAPQGPEQPPTVPQNVQQPQPALNWSHFKPEFEGQPAEDVEAHLLHTNDWMNNHNIPDDLKVGRFCLTLVGEARLWYESLQPIVNDWPALQDQFRQQYSKIGNTREQLFYAWRSFHYDENVETVGTYVNRIRQVAAMLGYGEPQILEVYKNTVSSKLYWILYPINDLRVAAEMAKRVLTKEKIDKQRKGQSSTSPFMKASQENKRSYEKGVTFDALGTIEKYSDSIDKLASLVNKMNIKWIRKNPSTNPEYIKGEAEDAVIDRIIIDPGKGHMVENTLNTEEEETIVPEATGLIIELGVDQDQEMTMEIEGMRDLSIDKVTEEKISDKIMVSKDIEQEV